MTIISAKTKETRAAGEALGHRLTAGSVVGLSGPLGVGKTIFAQGIAEALDIQEAITSPTFTLINEYQGRLPLYHMDLYRLASPEEFVWLGVQEMLHGDGVCLVEWSERAGDELPLTSVLVQLDFEGTHGRRLCIEDPMAVLL